MEDRRLEAAAHLHEVVHHAAGVLLRYDDAYGKNWLQQLGTDPVQPVHNAHRCGYGKIQRMGMPHMVVPLHQRHLEIGDLPAVESLLQRFRYAACGLVLVLRQQV
ncbi:hypothetical protein D3C75_883460 [compost metagenome]